MSWLVSSSCSIDEMFSVAWRLLSATRMMKGYLSGYSSAAQRGSAKLPNVLLPDPRNQRMRTRRSSSLSTAWIYGPAQPGIHSQRMDTTVHRSYRFAHHPCEEG